MTFRKGWEYSRPPGGGKKIEKDLFNVALTYRGELSRSLKGIRKRAFDLRSDEVDDLAIAATAMAEDLHADAGLWRSLEAYHMEFFGLPLPLLDRGGDAALDTFDERRFLLFFYTMWQLFIPYGTVRPDHPAFHSLAEHAAAFFRKAFANLPQTSPVKEFLKGSNRFGWEVKRKLVWLGTRSFLFRKFHEDYAICHSSVTGDEISTTDDFLCQECTAWSGLGAIDVLAAALDLPEEDRQTLRSRNGRHAAVYRIGERIATAGEEMRVEAVNEINGQPYRICLGTNRDANPFAPGMLVFGSLVPWRGDWYWSGTQRILKLSPAELAGIRRKLRQNGAIAYRYCSDLAAKAWEIEAGNQASFLKFYGSDLTVFANGAAAVAAEGARLNLPNPLEELSNAEDQIAAFYHPGEGIEMFTRYGHLLAGLGKKDGSLTLEEVGALHAFIKEDSISPAFVRRVIRETGIAVIEELYGLPDNGAGLEYLLHRYKGFYFRKRYPSLSLQE